MASALIVDYGVGNIGSVIKMANSVGLQVESSSKWRELEQAKKLILPGIGHFGHAMKSLEESGLLGVVHDLARNKEIPILGICLGMQLLSSYSEESGSGGLGLINASVVKLESILPAGLPVPHMGWNTIRPIRQNPLFHEADRPERFYFAHSYVVNPDHADLTIAVSSYGVELCAAVQQGNIFGVQFHPEKSHRFGQKLLENFGKL